MADNIFYTPEGFSRPVRLSEQTRGFAFRSLGHEYGLDTLKNDSVELDGEPGIDAMSPIERYDLAVRRIAEKAPLRICPGERISLAATLGAAVKHVVPAKLRGEYVFMSVSHLTVDFDFVLENGFPGLRREAEDAAARFRGTPNEAFSRSVLNTLDSFEIWVKRYVEALEGLRREEQPGRYDGNIRALKAFLTRPPETFHEAVQCVWACFDFTRLCGNWPGIGRIDRMLGKYLRSDLDNGSLTLDEAREILAHFFIKGCEWVAGGDYGSGDAQHYQNLVIAGVGEDGLEVTNEVTYLVLDIIEELGISDFPTTVRLSARSQDRLLKRAAEVIRLGGGTLAVYNEDLVIDAFTRRGYDLCEARDFANDGCWEVQIPGTTDFGYIPFDGLAILEKQTFKGYEIDAPEDCFPDFESIVRAYTENLRDAVKHIADDQKASYRRDPDGGFAGTADFFPCTVISVFERGCVEKGLSYYAGGPKYQIRSPHVGGLPDVVNSLYAIKKAVFDDGLVTLGGLFEILRNNWEGSEPLRQYVLNKYEYYGTDNDEADAIAARILDSFADACDAQNEGFGYDFTAGVSTFGRQLEWAHSRPASAHGRKSGDVLAANFSPTPGTDTRGATAVIRSYCKCPLVRMGTGAALDIRLMPQCVKGGDGIAALVGLMRGFVTLGGFFMQIDVQDPGILLEAQAHPEDHQTLSVRVSGWNARFVTLNREWQNMVIGQSSGGDKTFGGGPSGEDVASGRAPAERVSEDGRCG